jgi:hypothetical protein
MQPGVQLKYGFIAGSDTPAVEVAMAASQVLADQSGHFVYMNAGAATLCVDAVAYIFGWVEGRAHTPTVGDVLNCIISLDAIYRIPVNSGTFAVGMIGDLCDLSVSASVQGAQLGASDENLCIVVNGDADNNNWVDVKVNPAVQGAAVGVEA